MIKPEEASTVIGRTTRLQGEMHCAGDLQIEGDFDGTIWQSDGRLTVGLEAHVRADIMAQDVLIYGKVEGDIRAKGGVDMRSSSVVLGDIFASRISMEENSMLRGQVDPSRAGEERPPERKEIIAPKPYVVPPMLEFPDPAQPAPALVQASAPSAASQELFEAPPVLTQSGRQLPTALAAFAVSARQDASLDAEAYRKETSQSDEDALWRNRTAEE